MRAILIAACVAVSCQCGAATAQTLYECATHTGNSYQQSPCAKRSRMVRSILTMPEPPPTAAQLAARARKAEQDRAESAFLSHLAGSDMPPMSYRATRVARRTTLRDPRRQGDDACSLAKANRKATLQAVGLSRTYEILRRLDDAVRETCRRA